MSEVNRLKDVMVFDWDEAARIIKKEKPLWAEAGLMGDWPYTGGCIYKKDDIFVEDYTYLASTWALPALLLFDGEKKWYIECYVMGSETEWNEHTVWPDSAVKILKGE